MNQIKQIFRYYYSERKFTVHEKYFIILFVVFIFFMYFIIKDIPDPSYKKSICIFKNLTHYPCPGCGTTRGIRYLFHGYFEKALLMNPLSYLTVLFAIATPFLIIKDLIKKETKYLNIIKLKIPNYMIVIVILLTILNWIWNLYKGV